ncbi:hypothetical protein F2Q69_00050425 [Brassica cretica]|uniref:Uncharacterized protein n=1 Tax=Brassica cretica TaxID=69181 RepID=A0A8S9PZY3_BRACR|nr:hypothetical protein F2Q69_00050425 [Brassica cretica]
MLTLPLPSVPAATKRTALYWILPRCLEMYILTEAEKVFVPSEGFSPSGYPMEIVVPSKLRRVRIRISSRTSRSLSLIMSFDVTSDKVPSLVTSEQYCCLNIRVSNELGAGNPQVAKLAVYVIVGIAVAQGIVVVTVLLSVRKVLGRAFSSDPKIISYAASMIPIVACGNFLDGLQCVLSGVARGCGWQKIGACVNLGSYYLVGVPLGLLLGFHFHIGGRAKKATKRVGSSDDQDDNVEQSIPK